MAQADRAAARAAYMQADGLHPNADGVALIVAEMGPAVLALIGWVVLNIWLLTSFIAELHDFDSAWSVFFAILGLAFLLALGLALFGSLLGGVAGG